MVNREKFRQCVEVLHPSGEVSQPLAAFYHPMWWVEAEGERLRSGSSLEESAQQAIWSYFYEDLEVKLMNLCMLAATANLSHEEIVVKLKAIVDDLTFDERT